MEQPRAMATSCRIFGGMQKPPLREVGFVVHFAYRWSLLLPGHTPGSSRRGSDFYKVGLLLSAKTLQQPH